MNNLTNSRYWDETYIRSGAETPPLDIRAATEYGSKKIIRRLEQIGINGKRVLEIGAGNSAVLCWLGRNYGKSAEFAGLDYSESGCRLLRERANREGAVVTVYQADMFAPTHVAHGSFDLIYSLGVVEHFSELKSAIAAEMRFLRDDGKIFTVIPNMAGVLGYLTKRYNARVYNMHVPHTRDSLVKGHSEAGLLVEDSGFICSTNFGVLSSCFASERDKGWNTYKWLSRLTRVLWGFERNICELPYIPFLAPYIFVTARRPSSSRGTVA